MHTKYHPHTQLPKHFATTLHTHALLAICHELFRLCTADPTGCRSSSRLTRMIAQLKGPIVRACADVMHILNGHVVLNAL